MPAFAGPEKIYLRAARSRAPPVAAAKASGLGAVCDPELISRNPAARLAKMLPKAAASSRQGLDAAQTRRLLAAARSERLYPLYVLALMTGLRQGELFALRWLDVDLDAGRLSVRALPRSVTGQP